MKTKRLILNVLSVLIICSGAFFMGVPNAFADKACTNGDITVVSRDCDCDSDSCSCELPCTIIT